MRCAKSRLFGPVVPGIAEIPRALLLFGQRRGWGIALCIIAASFFLPPSACACFMGGVGALNNPQQTIHEKAPTYLLCLFNLPVLLRLTGLDDNMPAFRATIVLQAPGWRVDPWTVKMQGELVREDAV